MLTPARALEFLRHASTYEDDEFIGRFVRFLTLPERQHVVQLQENCSPKRTLLQVVKGIARTVYPILPGEEEQLRLMPSPKAIADFLESLGRHEEIRQYRENTVEQEQEKGREEAATKWWNAEFRQWLLTRLAEQLHVDWQPARKIDLQPISVTGKPGWAFTSAEVKPDSFVDQFGRIWWFHPAEDPKPAPYGDEDHYPFI